MSLTKQTVKKIIVFLTLFISVSRISATELNADLFCFDEKKVEAEFKFLSKIESEIIKNAGNNMDNLYNNFLLHEDLVGNIMIPYYNIQETTAPGKIPSFWFTFALSAVGTYFIYGAVAGPVSVGIVYFSTDKDRAETKKAIWGCVAGTLVGAGIKYLVVNL